MIHDLNMSKGSKKILIIEDDPITKSERVFLNFNLKSSETPVAYIAERLRFD